MRGKTYVVIALVELGVASPSLEGKAPTNLMHESTATDLRIPPRGSKCGVPQASIQLSLTFGGVDSLHPKLGRCPESARSLPELYVNPLSSCLLAERFHYRSNESSVVSHILLNYFSACGSLFTCELAEKGTCKFHRDFFDGDGVSNTPLLVDSLSNNH